MNAKTSAWEKVSWGCLAIICTELPLLLLAAVLESKALALWILGSWSVLLSASIFCMAVSALQGGQK